MQFHLTRARPLQAAFASALSFVAGGVIPIFGALAPTLGGKVLTIVLITVVGLILAGIFSGISAGSSIARSVVRIVFGGSLGMLITAGIGHLFQISGI